MLGLSKGHFLAFVRIMFCLLLHLGSYVGT